MQTLVTESRFWLRCFWVVVQLVAVYCLTNQASPFFYQRF